MSQKQPQRVEGAPSLEVLGDEVVAQAVGAAAVDAGPPLQPGKHYLDGVNRHRLAGTGLPLPGG